MQVVLESPSALERQFKITIPTGDIETEFEAKLAETANAFASMGFVRAKCPRKLFGSDMGRRFGRRWHPT